MWFEAALERSPEAAALACFDESLTLGREIGHEIVICNSPTGLGEPARLQGEWSRARPRRFATGVELQPLERAFRERFLAEVRARLVESDFEAARAEGATLTLDEALAHSRRWHRSGFTRMLEWMQRLRALPPIAPSREMLAWSSTPANLRNL